MNTAIHSVAPEDVMALLDGELSTAEAAQVSQHIDQCAECAELRDRLRGISQSLAEWTVPPTPPALDQTVEAALSNTASKNRAPRTGRGLTLRNWRVWAIAGGGTVVGALALVVFVASFSYYSEPNAAKQPRLMAYIGPDSETRQRAEPSPGAGIAGRAFQDAAPAVAVPPPPLPQPEAIGGLLSAPADAPLIARTAALTIVVKDLDVSRASLDSILARHHGYTAALTVSEDAPPRGLEGSLRIPVAELGPAIAEIRALGIVDRESQSGEEVTQQHTDLAARLDNARETEARLRDILAHRTGKMEEVLEVEDKLSETRGEIEQLEAEQKNLEHRIEFVSVDVSLVEQYEARLGSNSASIPNQMHNSFIAGLRHAGASLLSLMLFLEEYGPVLLVWLVLLGVPGILLWRRFVRIRNKIEIR